MAGKLLTPTMTRCRVRGFPVERVVADLATLPRGFPARWRGSCVPAAYLMLVGRPNAVAVQGWVGTEMEQHTWVVDGGSVIDPTVRQFRWWRVGRAVFRHEGERIAGPTFRRLFEEVYAVPCEAGWHYRRFARWIEAAGK